MQPEGEERPIGVTHYFFREASRRLWKYKRTSGVAIAMIAIALVILGGFLLVSENLTESVKRWQGRSEMRVYMNREATPEQIDGVRKHLASTPVLAKNTFVSPAAALRKFKRYFANLASVVDDLDQNPFPASFEIEVAREAIESRNFSARIAALRALPGVDDVQFDWEWVGRVRRLVNVLNLIGIAAGGILALAAAFTIANVIRLTMILYREEIEIMRLVGATENTIRGPFLIEGLMQGTIGGLIAIGALFAAFKGAAFLTGPSLGLVWNFLFVTFLPWYKSLGLVIGGIGAGLFGSWLSIRENSIEPEPVTHG
jgi:cell division transport system permease protein